MFCSVRLVLDAVFGVLVLSLHGLGQSLILQVAKKASVLKRRKSRNRMEPPGTPQGDAPPRCDSEADVVFYVEEPKAGQSKENIIQFVVCVCMCVCINAHICYLFFCRFTLLPSRHHYLHHDIFWNVEIRLKAIFTTFTWICLLKNY